VSDALRHATAVRRSCLTTRPPTVPYLLALPRPSIPSLDGRPHAPSYRYGTPHPFVDVFAPSRGGGESAFGILEWGGWVGGWARARVLGLAWSCHLVSRGWQWQRDAQPGTGTPGGFGAGSRHDLSLYRPCAPPVPSCAEHRGDLDMPPWSPACTGPPGRVLVRCRLPVGPSVDSAFQDPMQVCRADAGVRPHG
jgi:hypothetical protein